MTPDGVVKVYKNNTDFVGHSYGCHDNYLMDRVDPVRPGHPRADAVSRHAPDLRRRGQDRHRKR